MEKKHHVAMFTSPGMGHLIPFCCLANRLAQLNYTVTFIVYDSFFASAHAAPYLRTLADEIELVRIPLPQLKFEQEQEQQEHKKVFLVEQILGTVLASVPDTMAALSERRDRVCAFIVDMFGAALIEEAAKLGVETWVFFTSPAGLLSLTCYLPENLCDRGISLRQTDTTLRLPGLPPLHWSEIDETFWEHRGLLQLRPFCMQLRRARGVLVNSFDGMELAVLQGIQQMGTAPPVYAVGPLVHTESTDAGAGAVAMEWMGRQRPGSVVVVSFGSSVALEREQIAEIAAGLERSGHAFVWVLRSRVPRTASLGASAAYFSAADTDVRDLIGDGFLERTGGRGVVVPSWAAQRELLAQPAAGGFVTHCGWNSVLESIWHGVPMLAWPMFADQGICSALLLQHGVALRLSKRSDGSVSADEVQAKVTELMQGHGGCTAREHAQRLMHVARDAVRVGGTSWNATAMALMRLAQKNTDHVSAAGHR